MFDLNEYKFIWKFGNVFIAPMFKQFLCSNIFVFGFDHKPSEKKKIENSQSKNLIGEYIEDADNGLEIHFA